MPDRIIRDELLQSGRWLDLPSDSHRLIFENLILIADDYGNFEGGPRRMFRWMHGFTQIKAETDAIKVMSDLQDADMVLRYEANGKEYWHIQRFKNSRKYWSRKFPRSPYQESDRIPTKQEDAKNPDPTLTPIEPQLPGGVGVGVGELPSPRKAPDEGLPLRREVWKAYSQAYNQRYGVEPTSSAVGNSAIKRFVAQLPVSDVIAIAAFYVTHNNSFYVTKAHPLTLMAADAAKLRTEWLTGHQITQTEAQQADRRQGNRSVFTKLIEEAKNEQSES